MLSGRLARTASGPWLTDFALTGAPCTWDLVRVDGLVVRTGTTQPKTWTLAMSMKIQRRDELEIMNLDGALRSEHVDISLTGVEVAERGKHVWREGIHLFVAFDLGLRTAAASNRGLVHVHAQRWAQVLEKSRKPLSSQ